MSGDFKPEAVKGKIVLIGLGSSIFQDLHNTPIGWLPGITLNANAFLTLYRRDFLHKVPRPIELIVLVLGVILSAILVSIFNLQKPFIFIGLVISLFAVLSYFLLVHGYIWNYSFFPIAMLLCPVLAKKIAGLAHLIVIK